MLNIGNKKYRNMQEQVGWNSERIDKILEFLDGVNLSDNVVVISDMSQILTPDELEVVNRTVSFLVYDGSLYIKKSQDASEAKFDIIFTISGSTVITFTAKEITVTLSNGALGLATNSYSSYSKTQIDSLLSAKADTNYVDTQLALKANLSGANFTGPVTAPNITENMSGYSYTKTANNYTNIYSGVVKNGNKVTFVVFGRYDADDAGLSNNDLLGYFTIPSAIGSKLYPTLIGGNQILDVKEVGLFRNTNPNNTKSFNMYMVKDSATRISIAQQGIIGASLEAGNTYVFRYEATFLLSDNLAQ